jgi:NifB/MoaA-like Fe-S oxidoreductase
MVKDLACVPTGLTKYRDGLFEIADIDKAYSEKTLDLIDELNAEFGVPFLQPADEYFVKAERPLKASAFYGDFEQIENGIGLSTKFRDEFLCALDRLPKGETGKFALKKPKKSVIISGVSAAKLNEGLYKKAAEEIGGLTLVCLPVVNEFFGQTVTCTGLLTGVDILAELEKFRDETVKAGGQVFDEVIIAGNTLREFEDVFLCGMTLDELKKKLNFENIRVNRTGGEGLVQILADYE